MNLLDDDQIFILKLKNKQAAPNLKTIKGRKKVSI